MLLLPAAEATHPRRPAGAVRDHRWRSRILAAGLARHLASRRLGVWRRKAPGTRACWDVDTMAVICTVIGDSADHMYG